MCFPRNLELSASWFVHWGESKLGMMLLHAWGERLGPQCTTTHPFLRHTRCVKDDQVSRMLEWIAHKLALPLNNCCGFQTANPSSAFRGNLFFRPRQKFDDSLELEVYPFFQLNIHISLCSFISIDSLLWLLSTHDEAWLLWKTQIQKLQGDSEERAER